MIKKKKLFQENIERKKNSKKKIKILFIYTYSHEQIHSQNEVVFVCRFVRAGV